MGRTGTPPGHSSAGAHPRRGARSRDGGVPAASQPSTASVLVCRASVPAARRALAGRSAPRRRRRRREPELRTLHAASMRLAEYETVLRELEPCVSVHPDVDAVVERHPGLTVDAARSIYLQEVTRQLKEREGSYRRASRPARACHTLDPQRVPASPRARTATISRRRRRYPPPVLQCSRAGAVGRVHPRRGCAEAQPQAGYPALQADPPRA